MMKYLVLEQNRSKIVCGKFLRDWLKQTTGNFRVFRLCGMNTPVELYVRSCGKDWYLVDKFDNIEEV